jgi:hypothetical protein
VFGARPDCKEAYILPVVADEVELTVIVTTLAVNAASVARVTINEFSLVELSVHPTIVVVKPTLVNVSVVGAVGAVAGVKR